MYKIYIREVPVWLTSSEENAAMPCKADNQHLVSPYMGNRKLIRHYLDLLDKRKDVKSVRLYAPSVEALLADFQGCFAIVEAAGGYVLNAENALLVFYRRGCWDMPKGKIDPGETPEEAAVREVQEETSLLNVKLGSFLMHTYHTYTQGGRRILKKTWWYRMTTTDRHTIAQKEEDIEEIAWVLPDEWIRSTSDVYQSIRDVIECGLGMSSAPNH